MARVLLVFVIGLLLSVIASFFNESLGIYSLAVYAVIGLICGFLIWDLVENALFPAMGFLMIAIVLQYVLYDFIGLFDIVLSISIFSVSVALISTIKYLLLIDRPIHTAYR